MVRAILLPLTPARRIGHDQRPSMLCPKCAKDNALDAARCIHCGNSLSVAVLEVVRGNLPEKIHFLTPAQLHGGTRPRQRPLPDRALDLQDPRPHPATRTGPFFIEDQGSLHGVYVNAAKVQSAELTPGAQIQLGNVTLEVLAAGRATATTDADRGVPLDRAAAAPALRGPDPELDPGPEPGAGAGSGRGHADHAAPSAGSCCSSTTRRRRARYPAVAGLRLRVGRAARATAPPRGRARASPPRWSSGRSRAARSWPPATRSPTRSLGTAHERGRARPAHHRLHPPALAARGGGRERELPTRPRGHLRGQPGDLRPLQPRQPARRGGPRPPRRPRHRERAALRARAAHDRGAAAEPRSSSSSRRSWPPSARWPPASPTS